jgi:hypothetical protein
MAHISRAKSGKPYASFPLTAHPNGHRCRKTRGEAYVPGVWAHPEKPAPTVCESPPTCTLGANFRA